MTALRARIRALMGDEPQNDAPAPPPPKPRIEKPPAMEMRTFSEREVLTGSGEIIRSRPNIEPPPAPPKPKIDKPPAKEERGV